MKKGIIVLVIILGIGGLFSYAVMKDIPTMKAAEIKHIDISNLDDGTYNGEFSYSRWKTNVEVTVKDKVITDVQLLSKPLTPEKSIQVLDNVVKEQKNDVDVITGATASSKAYLKAVENALENN